MIEQDDNSNEVYGQISHAVRRPVLVFTVAACIAFTAFVWGYGRFAGPVIARQDRALGIVHFEKGQRMEAAGEYANAAQCYRLALDGTFDDPQYRTFTLKALGALLWWREGAEEALPYLEEAYAQPDAPLTLYGPLCDSLLQVGRLDDIPPVCERWQREAKEQGNPEQQAMAVYYRGRVAQERGEPARARKLYHEGIELHRGGYNAYGLGVMYFRSGGFDKSLTYLEQFLESGSGGRAQHARQLRDEIMQKQGRVTNP